MIERGFFYKVICVKIDPFYSEIIDEQNFGTQQEVYEFISGTGTAKGIALVIKVPQDCIAITA